MIRNFSPVVCELLDRPLVAHISTVSPAGRPQASLVWFRGVSSRAAEGGQFSPGADRSSKEQRPLEPSW